MRLTITAAAATLFLAACASTPPGPEGEALAIQDRSGEAFETSETGAYTHQASGLVCPASYGEFGFDGETLFEADGSEVACKYVTAQGEALTLYLISAARVGLQQEAQNAAAVIPMVSQVEYDAAASQDCMSGLAAAAAAQSVPASAEFPCYVFRGEGVASLLALREEEGWITKVRLTESVPTGDPVPAESLALLQSALRLTGQ